MRALPIAVLILLSLAACVQGGTQYTPPSVTPTPQATNVRTFDAPPAKVWDALIAFSGGSFFVLDNVVRDSYLLNLSFSSDEPSQFIDCGMITSKVSNLRGPRAYVVYGAAGYSEYEVTEGGKLFGITRRVSLTGKANIVLSEPSPGKTLARVNARYVVTRTGTIRQVAGPAAPLNATLSFNTGETGSDPQTGTQCITRFTLENRIIEGIAAHLGAAGASK